MRDVGSRIGLFSIGMALAVFCGVLAWGSFALLTAMMNPALTGADYWSAVRDRVGANPLLAGSVVLFGVGTAGGLALMVASLARRRRGQA